MRFLIALFAILLCSCVTDNSSTMRQDAEEAAKGMVFIKHPQSGLCFAYVWQGSIYGGPAIANVPCDKVEHLLYPKCQGGQK